MRQFRSNRYRQTLGFERLELRQLLTSLAFFPRTIDPSDVSSLQSVVDIDGDGNADVIAAVDAGVEARLSEQGRSFDQMTPIDMDSDGDLDVLYLDLLPQPSWEIGWYENTDGGDEFGQHYTIAAHAGDFPGGDSLKLFPADMEGDLDPDVIVYAQGEPITWYENRLAGDADDDGEVALSDFLRLSAHYGQMDTDWEHGDFTFDGKVSFEDFLILAANFGKKRAITDVRVERASEAVNQFASDLYEHFKQEEGNLFLSPLSIATALTMTYAGAAGETAAQIEEVLHLGSAPGIHDSFRLLLESLGREGQEFELALANAMWPQEEFPFHEDFVRRIGEDYGGKSQSLDYSNPQQAADIINSWVDEQTRGRIQDLVAPADLFNAVMVLTNSIYFNAFWAAPFDPRPTRPGSFFREDGEVVDVPMMVHQSYFRYSEFDGFEVLEMPYEGEETSMVFLLPADGVSTDDLSPETLTTVNDWLDNSTEKKICMSVVLPKFKTTVSSDLEEVLEDMGMPLAFSDQADFTSMTDASVSIGQVLHKASLEVNEQGTEAAAATAVTFLACFAAGTHVLTPDGEKPIEEIKVGDYVLSRNEHNVEGQVEPKLVEETFERRSETVSLHVAGQILRTTNEHPFFVRGKGWTAAGELRAGDILATNNGQWKEVEKTVPTGESETVYNFRVADHHTYFVGSPSGDFAIWTHNCYSVAFTADRPFHFYIRDNSTSATLFMGRISDPSQTDNELDFSAETQN